MGYKSELRKAEQETIRCVRKLKQSIKDQYGTDLKEWLKMQKEKNNENSNR